MRFILIRLYDLEAIVGIMKWNVKFCDPAG